MRRLGGIITRQLTPAFIALEARLLAETAVCASCRSAPRAEGRLHCAACQTAQRPKPLTPAQRQAAKERAIAISRAKLREGLRAGRFDLWT